MDELMYMEYEQSNPVANMVLSCESLIEFEPCFKYIKTEGGIIAYVLTMLEAAGHIDVAEFWFRYFYGKDA